MAKLTSKSRNALDKGEFALPAQRKYPIQDRPHAENAIARAKQMENKGQLSPSSADKVRARANSVLKGMADGGRVPTAMSPWSKARNGN